MFVSAVAVWEIAIKVSLGRLSWRAGERTALESCIEACGFRELAVTARHAAGVRDLPLHHGDPFDRLQIAQAIAEELRIVTNDHVFACYGVETLAAEG